jgi:hypothetical protein
MVNAAAVDAAPAIKVRREKSAVFPLKRRLKLGISYLQEFGRLLRATFARSASRRLIEVHRRSPKNAEMNAEIL